MKSRNRQNINEISKNSHGRFGNAEVMGIQAVPEVKSPLIGETALRDNNFLKISKMCEIVGVYRSGYLHRFFTSYAANRPMHYISSILDRYDHADERFFGFGSIMIHIESFTALPIIHYEA